ncbi:MAG: FAD-dependent oxidoreductase, partial [Rhodoferax sp.]|nr:FAD-dependent oxidoreductase [Rhodoferax sp.]
LVRIGLQTPGVAFRGDTRVTRLEHDGTGWHLFDDANRAVAQADVVVLANAMGCRALLQDMPLPEELTTKLQALHAMYGTVTLGRSETHHAFPATPINGMGSFVPHVPSPAGAFWAAGATFETDVAVLADHPAQHHANLQRLQSLLPDVAKALASQFQNAEVSAWSAARCVTNDRLPWVGPVELPQQPGLWVCAGMGSRGLSFSALCADFLAARLGGEPLPLEASLLRSLDINRPLSRKGQSQAATPFVASHRSGGD